MTSKVTFKVLFVCTGNRCRSPFAAVYFSRLVEDLPVDVLSAGTLDAPGMESPSELVDIARTSGLSLNSHRSRSLSGDDFADVDLAIGFERMHVAEAVVNAGIAPDKAFTLRELVRLLGSIEIPGGVDPLEAARAAVAGAAAKRSEGPGFVANEEMDDPFGRSVAVYRASAEDIRALCDSLFLALFGTEARSA